MILADEAATLALGARLAAVAAPGDAILLSGGLGAGKTSLARGLLSALGLAGEAPSPSFPILLDYPDLAVPTAHADLYRIGDPAELDELGLGDLRADGLLLVEWPEHGAGHPALADALRLRLDPAPAGGRRLTATVPPSWERRWPPR